MSIGPIQGVRTVRGSKFEPDLTIGGLAGKTPPYAGADISYRAAEVYGRVLDRLLAPYSQAPNAGQIFQGIAEVLTEAEAESWLAFPAFSYDTSDPAPISLQQAASQLRPELAGQIQALADSLLAKGFLRIVQRGSEPQGYMQEYMLGIVGAYMEQPGTTLGEASYNWFYNVIRGDSANMRRVPLSGTAMVTLPNEVALTGDPKLGDKIPMNLQIPDTRTVISYDKTSEIIDNAWRTAVIPCICRVSTEHLNDRPCDFPLEVCMQFDEDADCAIKAGVARETTKEEMHQILRECRDAGLVQMCCNAEHPLAICNCCGCCCVFLNSLGRGEVTLAKPSRFIPVRIGECKGCGKCVDVCPMGMVQMGENGAQINYHACVGCGLCVSRCNFGALTLQRKDPADTSSNRDCERQKYCYI